MRKFFSFRSTASDDNERSLNYSDPKATKVYWEKPWQSDGEDADRSNSVKPKNPILGSTKRHSEKKDSGESLLRRSQSYSSPSRCSGLLDGKFDSLATESLPGHSNAAQFPVCSHSLTSEWLSKYERYNPSVIQSEDVSVKIDSPSSCKDYSETSGTSTYGSPIPLKCKASLVTQVSDKNKSIDLYIDGEQERKSNNQNLSPNETNDGCLAENRVLVNSGRPPRVHCTAPSSPTYSKENVNFLSPRDFKNFHHFLSIQDWETTKHKPAFRQKHRKRFAHKLSNALSGRCRTKSQEYDSETTIEDIYEDTSELRQGLSSNGCAMSCSFSVYPNVSLQHNCGVGVHPWIMNSEDDIDELNIKLKEAEQRFMLMSEIDIENENLGNGNTCIPALVKIIKNINDDRKNLALEFLTQVQHRIAERCAAKEALKQAKIEYSTRIKKLEREKSELQSSLEKELDRRSIEWSSKLEKFQAEEQRLRDRVRELAEQNVSLQREVSSLSSRETETQGRIMNLEMQLNELTLKLEDVKIENQSLQQALSELRDRCESAEADRDFIERSYKAKDKENKDLERIVVRFQRMCNEYEKTITGLRQVCSDETGKQSAERGEMVNRLQLEQIRLSGVEQTLRKEIESCRHEMELLRHENVSLLERLQSGSSGCDFSFRLENEMHDRLDCLQQQAMSLLQENNELCSKLLEIVKGTQFKHGLETNIEFDGYYVVEYDLKFQGLRRGIENLRKSLQTLSLVLYEKSHLNDKECHTHTTEGGLQQGESQIMKDDIKLELKAETLLTRILREKLCFKEVELEQLQSELASSVRGHEIFRVEIQHLQDELSSLKHRTKDMELQMLRKDENFNQVNNRFEECTKELAISRNRLQKVSNERDHLWEEVNRLKEMDMLVNFEVDSLRKKIESLEEDILIKEGQISILKDSLVNKSPDIIRTPGL